MNDCEPKKRESPNLFDKRWPPMQVDPSHFGAGQSLRLSDLAQVQLGPALFTSGSRTRLQPFASEIANLSPLSSFYDSVRSLSAVCPGNFLLVSQIFLCFAKNRAKCHYLPLC